MRAYDLIVIGAGSGDMLFGPELDGLTSAIIEPDRFGGTCLNRGCIPSKMLVVAADTARSAMNAKRLGVHATLDGVDWPAIRDRVFGRIDPMHARSVESRRRSGVDVYTAPARFVAPRVLEVAGEHLSAAQIVIAAGSRPIVPPIPGLDAVEYHTSDTIMRVEHLPASLVIIGGGSVAAEMGHIFDAFGADVTIVQRGPRLLMAEDEAVSARFTELAAQRFEVLLDSEVVAVEPRGNEVAVTVAAGGDSKVVEAETLLIATGRRPNTDLLDATTGGLALDDHGHLVADTAYRTSVPGVWALGDATNHFQLKHLANAEMRVVRHNLVHPGDPWRLPAGFVPHAVFSEPPVAGVGLTEQEARRSASDHVVAVRPYSDTAYGWALEDTSSFVKLIADSHQRTLLGAHIIGPHAPILLQPLLQAMMLGQTVDELGRDVLYVHPALTEVIEQALLAL